MIVNAFIRWYQSFYHPFSWSGPFSISTKGSDVVPVCSSKLSIEDINLILNSSFASSSFVHQTLVSSVTDSNWIPNSPSILLNFCFICYQWPCAQKSRIDTVKIFSAWMGCYNEQNLNILNILNTTVNVSFYIRVAKIFLGIWFVRILYMYHDCYVIFNAGSCKLVQFYLNTLHKG